MKMHVGNNNCVFDFILNKKLIFVKFFINTAQNTKINTFLIM